MTKNNNTADERLWILKECAKMKSVKVEAPPDAKSPEQMLRAAENIKSALSIPYEVAQKMATTAPL